MLNFVKLCLKQKWPIWTSLPPPRECRNQKLFFFIAPHLSSSQKIWWRSAWWSWQHREQKRKNINKNWHNISRALSASKPGFDLPRQQWSLLNRFRTEQGHCGACRRKWRLTDTDLCPCGETQTMSHIVKSCSLTKLNGGLSRLHSVDEDAVSWLLMSHIRVEEEGAQLITALVDRIWQYLDVG